MADPKTVLVADNDETTLQLLATALKPPEWGLLGVANAGMAESMARRRSIDVVIIGLEDPSDTAAECAARIRSIQPSTRIILLATKGALSNVLQSIGEHVFSYFSKPFQIESLSAMVARAAAAKDWQDGIEVLSALPQWISLRLQCKRITADRVLQFFREIRMELSEADRDHIGMAFREMLLNAIEYGGHFDPAQTITVSRFLVRKAVIYLIQDPGEGFSLADLPQAALSNPPGLPIEHMKYRSRMGMRPGGFGILMTRELIDEVIYSEKGNEVLLIKHLKE
jgi:DNA-binding response OmpR family regulator